MNDDYLPSSNCITAKDFSRLERKVDDLTAALVGNPSMGVRGVCPRLDAVEVTLDSIARERIAEHSARRMAISIATTVAAFVGAIAGTTAAFLKSWFTSA